MNYYTIILGLVGGLGLFLYGMTLLSSTLKKLSPGLLKKLLDKITSNRFKSTLVGVVLTSIIQSSSATSVILIGFLNASLISLAAAIPVMLGANIGTTITAQLIAFKLTKSALLFVFIGAMTYMFAKKDKNKNKGLAILGFGILFLGLSIMSSSVKPLAGNETIINSFVHFGKYPFLGIVTGLVVTLLLQSSSTTVGMVIAFASVGLLDLPSSIYLVLGDNIGTTITAVIASIGGKLASKRLALGNALFKTIGTLVVLPFIQYYLKYATHLSTDLSRQIANAHTLFNVLDTMILLPFIPLFVKLLKIIIPGEDYEKQGVLHLDRHLLSTPEIAIKAVIKELCIMLNICKGMLEKAEQCIYEYNHKLKNEALIDEESVDGMQKNITEYLVELTKCELTDKRRKIIPSLLHSVNDLEKVGDFCEDIVRLANRLYENNLPLSKHAQEELKRIFQKTRTIIHHTDKAMKNDDHISANITLTIKKEINELIFEDKLNHIRRLEEGSCISDSGLVYSDILTDISRISDHLCNITKGILHIGKR